MPHLKAIDHSFFDTLLITQKSSIQSFLIDLVNSHCLLSNTKRELVGNGNIEETQCIDQVSITPLGHFDMILGKGIER